MKLNTSINANKKSNTILRKLLAPVYMELIEVTSFLPLTDTENKRTKINVASENQTLRMSVIILCVRSLTRVWTSELIGVLTRNGKRHGIVIYPGFLGDQTQNGCGVSGKTSI